MKIIATDNFARDYVSDKLIAENVPDYWADKIAKLLNERYGGEGATHYFKAIKNHEQPYKFEP